MLTGSQTCWLHFCLLRTPWAVGVSGTELPCLNGKRLATQAGFRGSEAQEMLSHLDEQVVEKSVGRAWAGPQPQDRAQGSAAVLVWGFVAPQ